MLYCLNFTILLIFYGVKPGKSFHSVLNDTILKDNRIPPEGFSNAAFREHLSQPVGATYADGQYWDQFELDLPIRMRKGRRQDYV